MLVGCSQWEQPQEMGQVTQALSPQTYLAGNNGSKSFPVPAISQMGQVTYIVRVDVAEPNPLLANSCTFQLVTTSTNGYVRTQQDSTGLFDGDLLSNPVMSGVFVYEQDTAFFPDMTVNIPCSGLPNTAQYSYQIDTR